MKLILDRDIAAIKRAIEDPTSGRCCLAIDLINSALWATEENSTEKIKDLLDLAAEGKLNQDDQRQIGNELLFYYTSANRLERAVHDTVKELEKCKP
jgi:hypothetical protein